MRALTILAALVALTLSSAAGATAAPPDEGKEVDRRPTVAVLYFDYTGSTESLGVLRKGLAQMLISDLAGIERVRLVERERLQEVLDELELSASKRVDQKTAARIGRLLGARYLVLGGFFDLGGALRVDARVVDVETGRILKSVGVTGAPGDFLGVEQDLAAKLQAIVEADLPVLPKVEEGKASRKRRPRPKRKPKKVEHREVERATARAEKPETGKPATEEPARTEKPAGAEKPAVELRDAGGPGRPTPPEKLATETAIRYSEALDAKDRGDKATARKALEEVVEKQPDFELARIDLATLIQ